MHGNDFFYPGPAGDFTGLLCCEMILLGSQAGVCFKKGRFDKKLVRSLCEFNDFINIVG